jgi:uncharacterized MAPEG superfamily protein
MPVPAVERYAVWINLFLWVAHAGLYYGVKFIMDRLHSNAPNSGSGSFYTDGDRLGYVVPFLAPIWLIQWVGYEMHANWRAILTRYDLCPYPWENQNHVDGRAHDRLNPTYSAKFSRALQNSFESAVMTTAAVLALTSFCDGKAGEWSPTLPPAYALMAALGNLIYIIGYFWNPNLRMFGFWLRGFWTTGGILVYCSLRAVFNMGVTITLPELRIFKVTYANRTFDSLMFCMIAMCVFWTVFLGVFRGVDKHYPLFKRPKHLVHRGRSSSRKRR